MDTLDNTFALLENTEILKFQGIYALGSEQEQFIYKLREKSKRFTEDADALSIQLEFNGEIVSSGILPKLGNSGLWETLVPPENWGEVAAFGIFDGPDLAKLDARIRWCRMLLEQFGSLQELEQIRKVMAAQFPRTRQWYAAKCLMHSERAFSIINSFPEGAPISDYSLFGLMREMIQFGETWAEAKFIINHGDATVSGKKYRKKSEEGAAQRRGDFADHTQEVLSEMKRLIDSGQTAAAAARITAANGIGTSGGANRALWQRHTKKPVTHP